MRTSRLSKETSRALSSASASPTARVTRSTRGALSRFALKKEEDDIEDAIKEEPEESQSSAQSLKRKRATRSSRSSQHFKNESDDEDKKAVKREAASDNDSDALSEPPKPEEDSASDTKPAKRQPKKRIKASPITLLVKPPDNWETVYKLVQKMRQPDGIAWGAAVDTMGCHSLADLQSSPRDQRFHTLISLMLSSQTKDTVTSAAIKDLQANLPGAPGHSDGLTLENILAVQPAKLNEMIHSVGFHNNKTKYIKQTAEILRDKWKSDIPDTVEGLMSLPGVGPKMAYLCLSAAWGRVEGIGVDVHVHRIANMWHWSGVKGTAEPEKTRLALQSWLPKDKWAEINHLLVGFGQTICTPEPGRRRCGECEVGLEGLCRVADRKKVNAGKKAREEGLKIEYEEVKVEKTEVEEGEQVKKEEVLEEMKIVKEEGGTDTVMETVPDVKDEPGLTVKAEVEAKEGGMREKPKLKVEEK